MIKTKTNGMIIYIAQNTIYIMYSRTATKSLILQCLDSKIIHDIIKHQIFNAKIRYLIKKTVFFLVWY